MQQEHDPLNLGGLPPVAPPSDNWPAIRDALVLQRKQQRSWKMAGATLAAAAIAAVAVGLNLQPAVGVPADMKQPGLAQTQQQTDQGATQSRARDSLIALSQRLETSLRSIRSDIAVLPTAALIYQVELEDLVAQVDAELSMNPDSTELWNQRVNLLLDLSQLYKNELRRESQRMASL